MKRIITFVSIFVGLSIVYSQQNETIKNSESKFFTDSIHSKYLKENRKYNIYLPKGFTKEKKYPIIFATDGDSEITDKKKTLDSLIESKFIKPLIFVASFANKKIADSTSTTTGNGKKVFLSYRNFEYVENQYNAGYHNPELSKRFQNHMLYFTKELIPNIEKKYKQQNEKNDRYFYGVSNGAGFGMSMLNEYPETIGTYLCFSTFGGNIQLNKWEKNTNYPNLYLEYGSEEPYFLKKDAEFIQSKYNELNLFLEINEFKGGHENKIWNKRFVEIVSKIF